MSLTGIKDRNKFFKDILLENLNITEKLHITEKNILIDVGAGNGNLSVILSLIFTENRVIAVEKNLKKAVFLKRIKRKLNLKNLEVDIRKIETLTFFPGISRNFIFFLRAMEFSSLNLNKLMTQFINSTFLFLVGAHSKGHNYLSQIKFPENFKNKEIKISEKRKIIIAGEKINIFKN